MKKLFNFLTAAAIAATVFSTQSCSKTCDPNFTGTDCKTCIAGYSGTDCKTKVCNPGFTGSNCDIETRARYLGVFNGTETGTGVTRSFSLTFQKYATSDSVSKVQILNLYNANYTTNATLQSDSSLNIPYQMFGTGNISGNVSKNSSGKTVVNYTVSAVAGSQTLQWTQN